MNRLFLVFVAPDDNPSDVRGEGTEPGNLVISWTVSFVILRAWKTFHSSRGFKRCHFSTNNNKLFCLAADRVSVQWARSGVQSTLETEGRGRGLVLEDCGQRFPVRRVRNANLRALWDQGSISERLWQRPRSWCSDWILWRRLWVDEMLTYLLLCQWSFVAWGLNNCPLVALQCLCLPLIVSRSWFTTALLQKSTGSLCLYLQSEENCRDTRYGYLSTLYHALNNTQLSNRKIKSLYLSHRHEITLLFRLTGNHEDKRKCGAPM